MRTPPPDSAAPLGAHDFEQNVELDRSSSLSGSGLIRRRRRRRLALIAGITAGVIVVVLAGGGGIAYFTVDKQAKDLQAQLAGHLQAGQSELEAAKASLKQANTKHDQVSITQAKSHFAKAKKEFALTSQIADSSALLSTLERLPSVGGAARSRHVAVDGIAKMGVALAEAGLDLADLEGQLITPPDKNTSAGRKLLAVLGTSKGAIADARLKLGDAQTAAASVDIRVIPSGQQAAFIKARGTIDSALAAIVEFERLVPVLTEILGGNGARTYLIEQANPAELRPGGGFVGTFTILKADHGALTTVEIGARVCSAIRVPTRARRAMSRRLVPFTSYWGPSAGASSTPTSFQTSLPMPKRVNTSPSRNLAGQSMASSRSTSTRLQRCSS